MMPGPFSLFLEHTEVILGEGAVIERLRRDTGHELDPYLVNSAFIYHDDQRASLEAIYRGYLEIGKHSGLPLLLSTPTWRASRERIEQAGYSGRDVNSDNYRFLEALRSSYGEYADKVVICGLLSCRGDAFKPDEALSEGDARQFHTWQAQKLAHSGVDFLLAATLPALGEALGLAQALAATAVPYVISFVLRREGTLLDGTPLHEAIAAIDTQVSPAPLAYMANCTHASNFRSAMRVKGNDDQACRNRVIGLFANTAALSPEELDDHPEVVTEEPQRFGDDVAALHEEFGLKVLGGCCGTDNRHIQALVERLIPFHR